MEVTKWLKPSISVSRIGDSASVQAVTRVLPLALTLMLMLMLIKPALLS